LEVDAMAHPKRKWSKARTSRHRSAWKLVLPGLVECPNCHTKMLRHKVCKTCGYLDGKEIINKADEIA
jgi:large subunit ribosomal protein L32